MNFWQLLVWKTRFLTTMDDWIRLGTMTLIAITLAKLLDLNGLAFTLLITIGVAIDVHDIVSKALEGKPII